MIPERSPLSNIELPDRDFFEQFRPQKEWFPNGEIKDHGVSHLTTTLVLATLLGRLYKQESNKKIDMTAICWAAMTHDTQLNNESDDFQHGQRAAEWVRKYFQDKFPSETIETIAYLCEGHVPEDTEVGEMSTELKILKDADGLGRQGDRIGDFDPRFLRLPNAQLLIPIAASLIELTSKNYSSIDEAFDGILRVAVEMGIVKQ